MTIRSRLLIYGGALTVIPMLCLLVSNLSMNQQVVKTAMTHNRDQGVKNLDSIVDAVYKMCDLVEASSGDPEKLRQEISRIKVGQSGYVYILQGSGANQGTYIVSLNNKRDGENIWNERDSNGNYFIQEMCRKASQLRPGEIGEQQYPWQNQGEVQPRMKVARLGYFQPWDWVIGAGAYEDDFQASAVEITKIGNKSTGILIVAVLLATFISLVVWWYIAAGIAGKIQKTVGFSEMLRLGDISQRIRSNDTDELGEMARIYDRIADELQSKTEVAEHIAEGDLTQEIRLSSEKDALSKALKKMTESLVNVLTQVKQASDQIAAGTSELSGASQSLSQGATEQASSLEEISSSMTELSSQTKTNAENASQANQLAKDAKQSAANGTQQVTEMMVAMNGIQTSSRDIVKIIKVIDDIAFQTNLLALNAAVEAARAGKHGKGFAVVAEEVRSLAARSAKAAKETSELISESMGKVENGIKVATDTVNALEQIESSVTKATDLVAEIAAASNEQAQGIMQINQGLNQIDSVTQRNTANAEQTASATQELGSRAEQLKRLIAMFKMQEGGLRNQQMKSSQRVAMAPKVLAGGQPQKGNNGWGQNAQSTKTNRTETVSPAAVIALDDTEFGKY